MFFSFSTGKNSSVSSAGFQTGGESSLTVIHPGKRIKPEGYRSIARFEDGFLAAGSAGRIDRISDSGAIIKSQKFPGENFNCILSDNQMVIATGDNGTLMVSAEKGIFRKIEIGTEKNINSLTVFNGKIIAGGDQGELLSGDGNGSFKKVHLALKGNIVSLSARTKECFGVTDKGEIIHSADGKNWDITDFNQVYSGYYKPCYFTKILATENRIALTGINDDGSPVLMFSNQGKVWTERILNYTAEQGMTGFLADIPNDIFYDDLGGLFYLVCSNGKLMKLSSCSQCNKLAVLSAEDLEGISFNGNTMMIVGGNFFIKVVNLTW